MAKVGRISRTARPEGAPYVWHELVLRDGERVVENELDECLQLGCKTQSDYDLCAEQVEARKRRAAQGRLVPVERAEEEATEVRSQPLLWEIRWDFSGRLLRLYHAEPRREPAMLLAAKYHWKDTSGPSQAAIDAAQDTEMAEAARRYCDSSFHPGPGSID